MVFQIELVEADARKLTQAVIQVIAQLDLLNAELARILRLKCGDIGALANAQRVLEQGSEPWNEAVNLIEFYRLLFVYKQGDGVAMRHWLRAPNPSLGDTPHRLIVDHHELALVIEHLRAQCDTD